MANVCFQLIAFNAMPTLPAAIEAVDEYGPVIVTEGPVGHYQELGYEHSMDETIDVLRAYVPPENVVHGQWDTKLQMFQAAEHLIPPETTHVWEVDADEVWDRRTIEDVLQVLDDWDSMAFRAWSFFGGFDRYMTGFEEDFEVHRIKRWDPGSHWVNHRPPAVRGPDGEIQRCKRHMDHMATDHCGWRFYHYSYFFPLQTMAKARFYEHLSPNLVIPDWFETVFWPWVYADQMARDDERDEVEKVHLGVHNWRPHARGECYTAPFERSIGHPDAVTKRLRYWRGLIDEQIRWLVEAGNHGAQLRGRPGW